MAGKRSLHNKFNLPLEMLLGCRVRSRGWHNASQEQRVHVHCCCVVTHACVQTFDGHQCDNASRFLHRRQLPDPTAANRRRPKTLLPLYHRLQRALLPFRYEWAFSCPVHVCITSAIATAGGCAACATGTTPPGQWVLSQFAQGWLCRPNRRHSCVCARAVLQDTKLSSTPSTAKNHMPVTRTCAWLATSASCQQPSLSTTAPASSLLDCHK